jgi:putative transposase
MPSRGAIKQYVEGGHYHVFNRGVEKRRIFLDDQDYRVFLHLLKYYLSATSVSNMHPLKELTGFSPTRVRPIEPLHEKVDLLCYCLMPNHFHLLIKQHDQKGMEKLLRRLVTNYVMYFNRRYGRVGRLFQGPYKAVLVEKEGHLLHLTRYIHQNPTLTKGFLNEYPYSSYPNYLGEKKNDWLNTESILSFFRGSKKEDLNLKGFGNYKEFVETFKKEPEEVIGDLAIEQD